VWVFNPKLCLYADNQSFGLNTQSEIHMKFFNCASGKCDPVFRVCVNDLLFISRKFEADQWNTRLWSTEVGVRAHSRQSISLLISLNVAVTWHPKQSHPVVIREHFQCRSLDEIVYEDRANNAALLSEHIGHYTSIVAIFSPTFFDSSENWHNESF
jgi:hypothetical protein